MTNSITREYVPKSTYSKSWQATTNMYRKYQDMDPIGLEGGKTFTPSYLKKKD